MIVMPLVGMAGSTFAPLAADMGMDTSYVRTQPGGTAVVTLTIKTDGTWTIVAPQVGSPTSGLWTRYSSPGVGSFYELIISTSITSGTPTITNQASSYTALSSDLYVQVTDSNAGAADVTVTVREIANTANSLSETTNLAADGL